MPRPWRPTAVPEEWEELEAEFGRKGTAAKAEAAEEAKAAMEAEAAYKRGWDKWQHCGVELNAGFEMYESANEDALCEDELPESVGC